jgi:PAS domain S-box-containing protein
MTLLRHPARARPPLEPAADALADLVRACAAAGAPDDVLTASLPVLLRLSGAKAALVVRHVAAEQFVVARAGLALQPTQVDESAVGSDGPTDLREPGRWGPGIARVAARRLRGDAGVVVLAWGPQEGPAATGLEPAFALVGETWARLQAEALLSDLVLRVDSAQQLAHMGDYDWHISSDTNRWSDQLYRIYGHEPQSFNASYDRFLSQIHPDDRERIVAIHQQAFATGEPFEMVERIIRPDGELRYLASNGQVVHDAAGHPVRVRGTCIDITDRIRAEQARERSALESEGAAAALREARSRRLQALEINDNIVQGLTAAAFAMSRRDAAAATSYVDLTLAAARRMMNEWLDPLDREDVHPGDLVRTAPSALDDEPALPDEPPSPRRPVGAPAACRILLVDDNRVLRALVRAQLRQAGGHDVVGEAGDGEEAVRLAAELQPHVVLLDLSMPRMDGLQALPLILAAVPGVRVIVLSGFDQNRMEERVLAAGAACYVEKGVSLDMAELIDEVLARPAAHGPERRWAG